MTWLAENWPPLLFGMGLLITILAFAAAGGDPQ